MSKNNSVSLTKKNYEALKAAAEKQGTSVYTLVNTILKDVGVAEGEEKVVLCVPSHLTRDNRDALWDWLDSRAEAILRAYYPETTPACH